MLGMNLQETGFISFKFDPADIRKNYLLRRAACFCTKHFCAMPFTFAFFRLAFTATLLHFQSIHLASCSGLAFHRRSTAASPYASSVRTCILRSSESSDVVANGSTNYWPYQVYKSSPFNPPKFDITTYGKGLAPGLLFITPTDFTPLDATKDHAPLIMNSRGQLIWNGPSTEPTNLRVALYHGHHVLTYWSGISSAGANIGHGYGKITFLDASYNEILQVCPRFPLTTPDNTVYPCNADLHESHLTARDTLLVTAYNVTTADLSSIGGPVQGWVYDSLFFELSPIDGTVLFRWSSLEHVPISQTKFPLRGKGGNQSAPFDYFHINSVVDVGDTFLVTARHTWTLNLVSAPGDVLWTLQGDTGGDFGPLPINARFVRLTLSLPYFPIKFPLEMPILIPTSYKMTNNPKKDLAAPRPCPQNHKFLIHRLNIQQLQRRRCRQRHSPHQRPLPPTSPPSLPLQIPPRPQLPLRPRRTYLRRLPRLPVDTTKRPRLHGLRRDRSPQRIRAHHCECEQRRRPLFRPLRRRQSRAELPRLQSAVGRQAVVEAEPCRREGGRGGLYGGLCQLEWRHGGGELGCFCGAQERQAGAGGEGEVEGV